MTDIVGSGRLEPGHLRRQFKSLTGALNERYASEILSPYTITLGDEFQGIARSLKGAVDCIFFLEEEIIKRGYVFKLHYVLLWGEINTPINRKIAYEMLGPGLTEARMILNKKQRQRPRFTFRYDNDNVDFVLSDLFFVIQHIIDRWRPVDFPLIKDMLAPLSNVRVGERQGKDRTLIWRRRQTLQTEEYLRLRRAILLIVRYLDDMYKK
jgi:hypothetical protein